MRRVGFLLFSAIGLVSCRDALGLDGLSYDQGQTQVEATGGAATRDDSDLTPFESEEPDAVFPFKDTDFPALWPADSLIVTMPASENSPYYWVYQPSEKQLYSYSLNENGSDLLGQQIWPDDVPVSHLVAVPLQGEPLLIAYSNMGWMTRVSNVLGQGTLEIDSSGGSPDRTHVVIARFQGEFFLVVYDAVDGAYRFVPTANDSESRAGLGNWGPGWTHIQPYTALGADGVLLFNANSGQVNFQVFAEGATSTKYSGVIDLKADVMTTVWQKDLVQVAFYESETGLVKVLSLAEDETKELVWEIAESAWQMFTKDAQLPEGLKVLAPLAQDPGAFLGFTGTTAGLYRAQTSSVVK